MFKYQSRSLNQSGNILYVMTKKKVLLLGIDPNLIDHNLFPPGWDANRVKAAAEDANKRLTEQGYEVQSCSLDLGETAESVVSDTLSREIYISNQFSLRD